jgi:type III pantothenate kinase
VVPPVTGALSKSLADLFHINPLLLNAQTDTGISLKAEHPERVGADLIADAVGAYGLIKDTCIVVDFGTATTLIAVEKPGILSGAAICAGLNVSIEALVGKTAQLQGIPLEIPASSLGNNTVKAMQSGLILGHLCMVEGLIDRMKAELGPAKVAATGGLVSLLAPHTEHFDYVEPMLTLDGLRIIAERNSDSPSEEYDLN